MRTAVISDIHVDINEDYDVIGALKEYLKENEVELLLIAGDISSYPQQTIETVEKLEADGNTKVLYVPGNHDMWNKEGKYENNEVIYDMMCKDPHCLSGKTYEVGDYILLGDVAWYDYSFGNPKYTKEEFDRMEIEGRRFQDSLYNEWSKDNQGKCDWFIKRFEGLMEQNQGKHFILMTHVLSHSAFTVPEEIGNWSYLNAFLGSKKLQDLCLRYPVDYAICGHVHYRKSFKEDGVTWMCRCLNYHNEWRGEKDIRKQIASAIEIIEL